MHSLKIAVLAVFLLTLTSVGMAQLTVYGSPADNCFAVGVVPQQDAALVVLLPTKNECFPTRYVMTLLPRYGKEDGEITKGATLTKEKPVVRVEVRPGAYRAISYESFVTSPSASPFFSFAPGAKYAEHPLFIVGGDATLFPEDFGKLPFASPAANPLFGRKLIFNVRLPNPAIATLFQFSGDGNVISSPVLDVSVGYVMVPDTMSVDKEVFLHITDTVTGVAGTYKVLDPLAARLAAQ